MLLATEPQQHDFNLPYQISHPQLFPDTDVAESADRYSLEVQPGDVVVAASDGLWDNMWDEQVLQLLAGCGLGAGRPEDPRAAVEAASRRIAQHALANSHDKEMRTPWSVAAGKHAGLLARLFARGGKQDDITVVVAIVC